MKKLIALTALMFSSCNPAIAGPYIEFGIAKADGASCIRDWDEHTNRWACSDSPLGNLTLGYQYKGFSFEVEHWSSLTERDYGLNLFSFKYRHEFFK